MASGKILATVAIVAGLGLCTRACNYDYGDGDATGNIIKLGLQGTFNKTWEGEMALANFRGARSSGSGNTMDFNVKDPAILAQLQKARDDMSVVSVHYKELGFRDFWNQDNSHVIVSVKEIATGNVSPLVKGSAPEPNEEDTVVPVRSGVNLQCRIVGDANAPK